MTGETTRLDEQLRLGLEGPAWHGPSVLEALEGVSAEQAIRYPIPGAHSIWEIVLHLCTDYALVLRRASGDGRPFSVEEGWPPCPAATAENWRRDVEQLRRLNRQLREAVRLFPEERLGELLVPGSPHTAYVQFIGVTQHQLYHAGQILLLRRALAGA